MSIKNFLKTLLFPVTVCACAIIFFVIVTVGAGVTVQSSDKYAEETNRISMLENSDTNAVRTAIRERDRERRREKIEGYIEGLDDGTLDVWSLFDNVYILGDSRSEDLIYRGFLSESTVYAVKGANLNGAPDGMSGALAKNPEHIIFMYGLNDADGVWSSAEQFIDFYAKVTEEYQNAIPDAHIYLCSIIPVLDRALEEDANLKNISEYSEAIYELCEQKGYTYIYCDSLADEHEDLYDRDGIHFKESMYPMLGEILMRRVLDYELTGEI